MKAKLRVSGLRKTYPSPGEDLVVLDGLNLEIEAGESIAITGPSGCGKSTLLHILGTLDRPTDGTVTLDGENPFALQGPRLAAFRNRRVGFVFQDHHLLPQCSVLENVLVPTLVAEGVTAAIQERARRLLDRVGLSDRLDHLPGALSGGERQRVAIARALIHQPLLLLCDEPTGNLDQATAEKVGDLFLELHEELQSILVVVTHSPRLARRFGRKGALTAGKLVEGGGGEEVRE